MRVQKCYIAQRSSGEIVHVRQVNMIEGEEWCCLHCQCPLIFHLPTRTSPPWFEHDIPRGQLETLLQCPWLAAASGKSSTIENGTTASSHYNHPMAMHEVWPVIWR